MPQYFFHLDGFAPHDTEGEELPDDEAARQEALGVARDLSRNRRVSANERLIVTNAKGDVIHEQLLDIDIGKLGYSFDG